MSWEHLIWFAATAAVCWLAGAVMALRGKRVWATSVVSAVGSVVFFAFIVGMWISLERPPLRTMGETRLWYSF
ncbi:MAG: cytochrome C assembly protein, partial [Alistipes sp.]|nr:cytochrome C assembly protein [Alistipes sp.]